MSLDPHHVHNFWGASPALDLCDVVRRCRADQAAAEEEAPPDAPFSTLLVGTNVGLTILVEVFSGQPITNLLGF